MGILLLVSVSPPRQPCKVNGAEWGGHWSSPPPPCSGICAHREGLLDEWWVGAIAGVVLQLQGLPLPWSRPLLVLGPWLR